MRLLLTLLAGCVRAFGLRCPHCLAGRLRRGWFAFHRACPGCGYVFAGEEGDFWGGMVFSYTFASIAGIATAGALYAAGLFGWEMRVYVAAGAAVLAILGLHPFAKALWVHLLYHTRGGYPEYRPPGRNA